MADKKFNKEELMAFAFAVDFHRKQVKLSWCQLAKKVGVSNAQIYHIRNGDNLPSLPVYRSLCTVLNTALPPLLP